MDRGSMSYAQVAGDIGQAAGNYMSVPINPLQKHPASTRGTSHLSNETMFLPVEWA